MSTASTTATLAELRRTSWRPGLRRRAFDAPRKATSRPRSAGSPRCSSTRSRPSTAPTASRSRRASAPSIRSSVPRAPPRRAHLRVLGARGLAAADRGLAALPERDERAGPLGHLRPGDPRPRRPRRAGARADPRRRARSARATSRATAAAECGTGSRRSWCSSTLGPGELAIAGRRRASSASTTSPSASSRREHLEAPTPTEDETLRRFALRAVRARGALTEAAIGEHWRLKGGKARLHHHRRRARRRRAAARGRTSTTAAPPFYVDAGAELDGDAGAARALCRRSTTSSGTGRSSSALFGFRHVIEVYKREHERAYGYYVLPLLAGDRFVGRADLKADRAEGVLRVKRVPPRAAVRGDLDEPSSSAPPTGSRARSAWSARTLREVTVAEARRIAVRAQLLDGSATDVLATVRHLGFLQLDPISSVAPPQHLVLWSRLRRTLRPGRARPAPLGGSASSSSGTLSLPRGRPAAPPGAHAPNGPADSTSGVIAWLKENATFRRYVLRELERRGPLLSREIEDHRPSGREAHRWWGARKMGLMLGCLNSRGEVAVVGRRGKQRVWDLADRWYPETERLTWRQAEPIWDEKRFRALGVRLAQGRLVAHPDARDGPVPAGRTTFLSPFDRLIHDRDEPRSLWDFVYRLEMYVPKAKRQYGYYVIPILSGDRIVGRIEPLHDRKRGTLRVLGTWWEGKPRCDRPAAAQPRPVARRVARLPDMDFETRAIHAGQEPDPATGAIITPIYQTSTYVQEAVGVNKGYDYARVANPTRTALAGGAREPRGRRARHRVQLRARRDDDADAPRRPRPARRADRRRLRRRLPHDVAGLRAEGLPLHLRAGERVRRRASPRTSDEDVAARVGRDAVEPAAERRRHPQARPTRRTPSARCSPSTTPSRRRTCSSRSSSAPTSSSTRRRSTSAATPTWSAAFVATNDAALAERLRFLQKSLGAVPGPFDAWLVLRGMKTLAVRMRQHCENARRVAEFLESHAAVERVLYPGLESHPGHEVARAQMRDFGGMVSFLCRAEQEAVDARRAHEALPARRVARRRREPDRASGTNDARVDRRRAVRAAAATSCGCRWGSSRPTTSSPTSKRRSCLRERTV